MSMTNSGEQKISIIFAFALSASYLFLQQLLNTVARRAPSHAPEAAAADPALPEGNLDVVRGAGGGGGRRCRVCRARRVERDRHGADS